MIVALFVKGLVPPIFPRTVMGSMNEDSDPLHPVKRRPPNVKQIQALQPLYPEIGFAGFCRDDTNLVFYIMVNALVEQHMTALDFGAGRGSAAEWNETFLRRLLDLKGKCAKVIGFDVDPAVQTNTTVDEAVVGAPGAPLPFADASIDLIVSRSTFEHIADAPACAAELTRVLKPGGWLCAITPNKWGVIALGAVLVPESLHYRVLRFLEPTRQQRDTFPAWYRMNTIGTLRRLFPEPVFRHASYYHSGAPIYHANRTWLAVLWQLYDALIPSPGRRTIHAFIQKCP